jgi:F0F1-type ATP synthase assembly protein I
MEDANPPPRQEPDPPADGQRSPVEGAVALLSLGLACAVSLALAAGLGYLIDGWLHTSPVFTLVGLAFGMVAAVLMAVTTVRRYL